MEEFLDKGKVQLSLAITHKTNFSFATTLAKVCINKIMLCYTIVKSVQNRNSCE